MSKPIEPRAITVVKVRAGELKEGDVFRLPTKRNDQRWQRVTRVAMPRGSSHAEIAVNGGRFDALHLVELQVRATGEAVADD